MTISPARLAANRANASRSTGPKSFEGKLASSRNATRHGLLSRQPLLADEDPVEYDELRDRLIEALAPEGPLEEVLLDGLLGALWRLRRLRRVETALYSIGAPAPVQQALRLAGEAEVVLGAAFSSQANAFAALSRYEATLVSTLRKTMTDLERLRAAREANDADLVVISGGGFVSQDRGA